jgi:hypothetical protein
MAPPVKAAFERQIIVLPISSILPLRTINFSLKQSVKYQRQGNQKAAQHAGWCLSGGDRAARRQNRQPLSRISRAAIESITSSNVGGAPKIVPLIAP